MKSSNIHKNLISVYNKSCQRPVATSTKNKIPSIKPSMLGSPCVRKNYYSYNKVDEDIAFPLANARIAELGNAIGRMLVEAFIKENILIKFKKSDGTFYKNQNGEDDFEFRVSSPDLGVKLGKIDAVCVLNNELWLSEFKSIKYDQFVELRAPKPDHLIQGVLYLYLFNKAIKDGEYIHIQELSSFPKAQGMRFLYYGKDKSELKEFVVTEADEIFKQIVLKVELIKDYTTRQELPPKTEDYCRSCPWQKKCEKNQLK